MANIRSLDFLGSWLVNDRRYFENAHLLLRELEQLVIEVNRQWPKPLTETITQAEAPKDLWQLARKRDLVSDSVKVFAAMSVEAFINFYGVLRLGEAQFNGKFERQPTIKKLKLLLTTCDSIEMNDDAAILKLLGRIGSRRNDLVHPKTREVEGYVPGADRGGEKIPDGARDAVSDMIGFFSEFTVLVPGAIPHVPPPYVYDA